MKALKYIVNAVLIVALVWSCKKVEDNFDFVATAQAPSNITALYGITQDNTGVVTITPNGEGATSYAVHFGDGTAEPETVKQGKSVTHTYLEGEYQVRIVALGVTGKVTEVTQNLVVSFRAPENLVVVIENDQAVSKKVNVTANADFATFFDVYFGEVTDETPVSANIGETASYTYQDAGTYSITVVAKGGAIATTDYTQEFVVTAIVQPTVSAATPQARNAADVISIYSAVYTDVAGTNYFPDWGQAGQGSSWAEFDLNGDKMLQYINLSYQGIGIGETIDVSGMEFLHMDVWTADVSRIETSLINGQDGASTEKPVWSELTADAWTSIDIPISAWTDQGLSVNEVFQLKFVGDGWAAGTVFIDNIYFYVETPSAPVAGAPVPTAFASTVTSVFSDTYTNITSNEWNPGWGQTTTLTTVDIDGNNTLKYEALNYTGIVLDYDNPTDLSGRTHVHFDYWTTDATSLAFKIVNTSQPDGASKESEVAVSDLVLGSWQSVDIPLSEYTTNMEAITQLLFSSSSATVYIDNLYFYTELSDAPTTAAPTPTVAAADVISVFSDAYTPITSTEWNPGWGQTTVLTTITLEGNETLKYEALNYTGIVLDYDNPTDVSGKTYVHFDYWTNDATSLGFKLVNTSMPDGPTKEHEIAVSNIVLGAWTSVDIPLADYTTNLTGITQMLFASSTATVYIDNLYFH
ncbi:MAG: hypothetical protein JW729_05350 [Bacteroidales bacterium]|nr:hypothetical protein [Bacteroidales bacterium]